VTLFDALATMREKLTEAGQAVPIAPVRVFEVPQPLQLAGDRLVISRSSLVEPEVYASRFDQLANDGRFAWLNVSAYGLVAGFLVVGIELPPRPSDRPVVRPKSINFSGPPLSVIQANWDAIAGFAVTS